MDLRDLNLDQDRCCGQTDQAQEHHCCGHHDQGKGHHCCGCHSQGESHTCCGHHSQGIGPIVLTRPQADFLRLFGHYPFLPLVRFLCLASQEDDLESVSLPAVYLERGDETLDEVKATGALLTSLEKKKLITLDYDMPLQNYDYHIYKVSAVFALFRETVAEGAKCPGFLFDTAALEVGSMALTELGQTVLEKLDELEF